MASKTRVPQAEITGIYGALVKKMTRRMFGEVPEGAGVMWHYPAVFKDMMGFGRKTEKWDRLDPNLATFAAMAAASTVGCSFCLDLGYFMAHNKGLDEAKAREVPLWRDSPVFAPVERRVLEYAEAMSQTPPAVTDEMSAALLDELGAPALVELTARIGLMNSTARINIALVSSRRSSRRLVACSRSRLREGTLLFGMSDDPFVSYRALFFTVAYEMLGSAADAEDVVQEAWLRWANIDQSLVRDPKAYAVRIVTRKALDRLRALTRQREDYVGEWLPEPLLTSPDVAEDLELAESVSIAMLTVLETLVPAERAVFVLREVFDVPYDEIAEAIGKTPAAVRQIAHRAREHVASRRPRMQVDWAEQRAVVGKFVTAISTGDLQELLEVLAPDVVFISDGGGLVPTARKPISGAEKLVAVLTAGFTKLSAELAGTIVWLNGAPGALIDIDGQVSAAVSLRVESGRITHIFAVWNPDKLVRLKHMPQLSRAY